MDEQHAAAVIANKNGCAVTPPGNSDARRARAERTNWQGGREGGGREETRGNSIPTLERLKKKVVSGGGPNTARDKGKQTTFYENNQRFFLVQSTFDLRNLLWQLQLKSNFLAPGP